jgi:Arc/MetJ family transcription regulator
VPQLLSPRDFALARSFHAAGIALATVLVGIDSAFEQSARVSSLAFCQRRILELAGKARGPELRPSLPAESVSLPAVRELLETLEARLASLRPGPLACFEPPLRKIQELKDLLAVAARPNWDYLRGKLGEIDDDVSAALLQAVSSEERSAYDEEARRAVERQRGKVAPAALADARARFALQRAREKWRLPRVSLV